MSPSKKATSATQVPRCVLDVLDAARKAKKTIVLVTGVFDIFHGEHRTFLEKAKSAGDLLVVGLESDIRVKMLKGPSRPIISEEERLAVIEQQGIADVAFILPEEFTQQEHFSALIKSIHPDILAVSSHTNHLESKREIMKLVNGVVMIVHKHNPRVSTTLLVANELEE